MVEDAQALVQTARSSYDHMVKTFREGPHVVFWADELRKAEANLEQAKALCMPSDAKLQSASQKVRNLEAVLFSVGNACDGAYKRFTKADQELTKLEQREIFTKEKLCEARKAEAAVRSELAQRGLCGDKPEPAEAARALLAIASLADGSTLGLDASQWRSFTAFATLVAEQVPISGKEGGSAKLEEASKSRRSDEDRGKAKRARGREVSEQTDEEADEGEKSGDASLSAPVRAAAAAAAVAGGASACKRGGADAMDTGGGGGSRGRTQSRSRSRGKSDTEDTKAA